MNLSLRYLLKTLCAAVAGFAMTSMAAPAGMPDALLTTANPRVLEVIKVQESVTTDLMELDGILGTSVSEDDAGDLSLVVYVNVENPNRGEIMRALPRGIRGVKVAGLLTEPFRALAGKSGGKGGGKTAVSHTAIQTPPVQLGTSGGWSDDLANGYCCAGTLGSLVQVDGAKYILSNYHVLEADTVPGGNRTVAEMGGSVIQPGLIDVGCDAGFAQGVATLSGIKSLPDSNVDAAIAMITDGAVRTDGSILEIGVISSRIVDAKFKQAVKKSGRTTGLTRSRVSGLNATVSVQYDNECAGTAAFTKTFTGQIIISNGGSQFLAGGDSGSLMVEDLATKPRAVGLLFAGSSTLALANPIGQVLDFIGGELNGTATMVGN